MINRRVPRTTALLVVVALLSIGCYDHRRRFLFRTLAPGGRLDAIALTGALNTKFPADTPLEDLKSYVAGNKGTCIDRHDGKLWCEIPLRGFIMTAELVGVEVSHSQGKIERLRAIVGGPSP